LYFPLGITPYLFPEHVRRSRVVCSVSRIPLETFCPQPSPFCAAPTQVGDTPGHLYALGSPPSPRVVFFPPPFYGHVSSRNSSLFPGLSFRLQSFTLCPCDCSSLVDNSSSRDPPQTPRKSGCPSPPPPPTTAFTPFNTHTVPVVHRAKTLYRDEAIYSCQIRFEMVPPEPAPSQRTIVCTVIPMPSGVPGFGEVGLLYAGRSVFLTMTSPFSPFFFILLPVPVSPVRRESCLNPLHEKRGSFFSKKPPPFHVVPPGLLPRPTPPSLTLNRFPFQNFGKCRLKKFLSLENRIPFLVGSLRDLLV